MNNLRKLIRELVEEELSEVTTTGDIAGYQTPYAFAGKNKSKRKKSAEQSGYTLADGMGDEQSDSTEDNEPLIVRKKMGENKVSEAVTHYHEFKSDATSTPRQKIGRSIREINQQLSEIEKTVHMCSRLKTEIGVEGTELWKRTQRHLGKIEERINRVASKIRDIKA